MQPFMPREATTPRMNFPPCQSAPVQFSKTIPEKPAAACTPSITNPTLGLDSGFNCFSGNLLNWALMSSLDLSRKALMGFGFPKPTGDLSAGEVFTYKGCFVDKNGNTTTCESCTVAETDAPPTGCQRPLSRGQWQKSETESGDKIVCATINIGGSNYTYGFKMDKGGGDSSKVKINVQSGTSCPPFDDCKTSNSPHAIKL